MVHNNKILTVSYGTFSCTLEGFDDSFGTMTAIAEYFRDLAADDRYFGAEPPQPDADMLARIAQREVSRRVEARSEKNGGIVLRASDADAAVAIAATEKAPEAKAEQMDAAPAKAEPAPVTQAQPAKAAQSAEDLDADAFDTGAFDTDAFDTDADDVQEMPAAPAPQIDTAPVDAEPVDADLLKPAPEAPVSVMFQPDPAVAPAADSIAAKLQRIRAVVSQNEAAAISAGEIEEDYTEDEHAQAFVGAALTAEAEADEQESPEPTLTADDEFAASMKRLDAAFDAADSEIVGAFGNSEFEAATDAINAAFDDEDMALASTISDDGEDQDDDGDSSLFDDLDSGVVSQADLDQDDNQDDDDQDDDDDVDNLLYANLLDDADTDEDAYEDEAGDEPRVFKVSRVEFEAAIATGELEEFEDEQPEEPSSSLSDDDENDLMRELAEVESEVADTSARHTALPEAMEEDEADVSRLMAAAQEKMQEPETASSRDTYNHLRAAVAAAEAEKSAGRELGNGNAETAYHEDLESVVRPRRPVAKSSRPERTAAESRPAPLKLVAEQRVDGDAGLAHRGPVRPRRVAATTEAANMSDGDAPESGFVDFASNMGATELPDLLEAAAAYLSFVEGRDQFSRPQLMNKIRQIEAGNFNREDSLRSFGKLLREGKIEKTGGGRFTASGDIGFHPDKRAFG